MDKKKGYLGKRISAFGYALNGLLIFFKEGAHAKIHLLAAIGVICLSWYVSLNRIEWAIILTCISMVLISEIINSAVEKLADRVSTDYHPLIKAAKDLAAGAVLVASIISVVIGGLIFYPYLFN